MRFPGFVGPSYTLKSVNYDCQSLINLYPEKNEMGTGKEREPYILLEAPGKELLVTLPASPHRGTYRTKGGRLFAVGGNKLYELSSSWVATERGTLNTSEGVVSMSDNGLHLCVVDNPDGYFLTLADNTFAETSDPDFEGASQVVSIDGYFIFLRPDTDDFQIAGPNSIAIDALDIATSEGSPDNGVAIVAVERQLFVLNELTTEIFQNTGNADFPFERVPGGFIEIGCAAQWSAKRLGKSVIWLGQDENGDGVIYQATGYVPQRISTHAVEEAIRSYGDVSTARAWTYQMAGHEFYVINFPNASSSWCYDATTGFWHERCYTNQGELERDRADDHAFCFSTHIVGDYENGNIYRLSASVYHDNENEITRRRRAPHVTSDGNYVTHDEFQLDIEPGVGLDGSGDGTDPQVMLRWSDDGGKNWSNEQWRAIGKIGEYKNRCRWQRLGTSRDRVYEVTVTDKVPCRMLGAWIQAVPEAG